MTAYELFEKVYYCYMEHFMSHLWSNNKISPKAYIMQSFNDVLNEYGVVYACNTGFSLSFRDNPQIKKLHNIEDLRQIEVQAGYWLCYYDDGDWLLSWYASKIEAKVAYKRLYRKYFRHQDWYYIILVRGGNHK